MIGLKKEIFFQVALENSIVSSKALYQNSIVKRTIDGENCVRKRVLMGGERERESLDCNFCVEKENINGSDDNLVGVFTLQESF